MGVFLGLSVCLPVLIALWLMRQDPKPIKCIYSQPNKWYALKYGVFKLLLWQRKREQNQRVNGESAGMGRKSRNSPEDMDKVQLLDQDAPKSERVGSDAIFVTGLHIHAKTSNKNSIGADTFRLKAVDAVYLTGSNAYGQFLVAACARRHDNHIQTLLFLRIPEIGLMQLPSIPDTSLLGTHPNEYAAGGLLIKVVEPMKKWTIKYDGKLRVISTGQLLQVKFDLTWTSCTKYFDFDTDLHPNVLCDAVAREVWSREFFDTLKSLHQTHYEQFGDTRGTVSIDGYEPIKLDVRGVRDHSYGKVRNWQQLHRYCIQYASFKDGTCLCVAAISMPATTSRLHCGYFFHPSGQMEPVSWSDLEFYNLGDDGKPVNKFTINFKAGNQNYKVEVEVLDSTYFYIGDAKRDAKIYERYCRYVLNDEMEGYGLSEWEYRNTDESMPVNEEVPGIKYYTKQQKV